MKNGAFKLPEQVFRPLYQEAYRAALARAPVIPVREDMVFRKKGGHDKTKAKKHAKTS
jgi:hypothetical protein